MESLFNPQSEEQRKHEESKQTRRNILKVAGGVVGAAAIGFGISRVVNKDAVYKQEEIREKYAKPEEEYQEMQEFHDKRVYRSGEFIETPVGRLGVEDWKIIWSELGFINSAIQGVKAGKSFMIKAKNSEGFSFGEMSILDNSEFRSAPSLPYSGGILEKDREKYFALLTAPSPVNKKIRLEIIITEDPANSLERLEREAESGKRDLSKVIHKGSKYIYDVTLNVEYGRPIDKNDKVRIMSETSVSQSQLQGIHMLHRDFESIKPVSPIYVFKGGIKTLRGKDNNFNGDNDGVANNMIRMSAKSFISPDYPGDAEQTACHELTHSLVANSKLNGMENVSWGELAAAHSGVLKAAPENEFLEDIKAFQFFTESHYILNLAEDVNPGHPYDNADELVASAVTVFRYFPNQFIAQYNKLSGPIKEQVKSLKDCVLNFLKSFDDDTEQKKLKKIIPHLDIIKAL